MTLESTSGPGTSTRVLRALNVALLVAFLAGAGYGLQDAAQTSGASGGSFEQGMATLVALLLAFLAGLVALVLRIPPGRSSQGWASILLWVPIGFYVVTGALALVMPVAVAAAVGGVLTVLAVGASVVVIHRGGDTDREAPADVPGPTS